MLTILFYVSGHGYGHAVRMAEVMRELRLIRPDARILVRTQAPRRMLPEDVEYSSAIIDSGVVERKAGVVMDEAATVDRLQRFLADWDAIVESEIGFVSQQSVDLVVADIPPIAGDIAYGAGVPCIAISNFTWDWIYEPYTLEHLQRLEQGYSRMDVLLRLPFSQPDRLDVFRSIVDAPLIARRSPPPPDRPVGSRLRALLGSRAKVSTEAFERATRECLDIDFVVPSKGPGYPEALAACDLVIAKLGFSMLAECIAGRKPLAYPPRQNFREESILQSRVSDYIPAVEIPLDDFYAGSWVEALRTLRSLPFPQGSIRLDGARFCAEFVADYLSSGRIGHATVR